MRRALLIDFTLSHGMLRGICSAAFNILLVAGLSQLGGCNSGSGYAQPDLAVPNNFTIGGSVTGMSAGTQVTLLDNGGDTITVTSDTTFTFPTKITAGSSYNVTIGQQPALQRCTVTNGSATVSATVSNVTVSCVGRSYIVLHQFGAGNDASENYTGSLVQGSDGNFYGLSYAGGTNGLGTLFSISPSGSDSVLYSFASSAPVDGYYPYGGGLVLAGDGNFYGMTNEGGTNGFGTIFRATPGGVVTTLYEFTGGASDGSYPESGLTLGTDGNLYGVTTEGGQYASGVAFKMTLTGTYSVIYHFGHMGDPVDVSFSSLVLASDGNFYGVGYLAGANGYGGVFKLTPAGVETVLYSFTGPSDGANPSSTLVQGADGDLYGMTSSGGANGFGTAFKISTTGTFTLLHTFAGAPADAAYAYDNPLVLGSDGNFYGMTASGGTSNNGTLFQMTPSGTITILHSFEGPTADGANPYSGLTIGSDGYIYGTTAAGGANNGGVFFRY